MEFGANKTSGEILHTSDDGSSTELNKIINELRSQISSLQGDVDAFRSDEEIKERSRVDIFSSEAAALKPVGRSNPGSAGTSQPSAGPGIEIDSDFPNRISIKYNTDSFHTTVDEETPANDGLLELNDTIDIGGEVGDILILKSIDPVTGYRVYEHLLPPEINPENYLLGLTSAGVPTWRQITNA